MPFLSELKAIQSSYDQIDEIQALADLDEQIPIGGIEDIQIHLIRGAKGEVLTGQELRQAGQTLSALRQLAWFLVRHQDDHPNIGALGAAIICLLYTSPSPRDRQKSRMPSSA